MRGDGLTQTFRSIHPAYWGEGEYANQAVYQVVTPANTTHRPGGRAVTVEIVLKWHWRLLDEDTYAELIEVRGVSSDE